MLETEYSTKEINQKYLGSENTFKNGDYTFLLLFMLVICEADMHLNKQKVLDHQQSSCWTLPETLPKAWEPSLMKEVVSPKIHESSNLYNIFKFSKFQKRKDDLLDNFQHQFHNNKNSVLENKKSEIENNLTLVSSIEYKIIDLNISPIETIDLSIDLNDNLYLSITMPYGNIEGMKKDEVIFMLYESGECLVRDTKVLKEVVKEIQEYLS